MNLEKLKEFTNMPFLGKYDFHCFLLLFIFSALFEDLGCECTSGALFGIWLLMMGWWLGQFIFAVIIFCIEKKRSKRSNVEKLIDEEIKKGN